MFGVLFASVVGGFIPAFAVGGYIGDWGNGLLNRRTVFAVNIEELRYVADRWRMDYNHYQSHSYPDYLAPAAFATKYPEQWQ